MPCLQTAAYLNPIKVWSVGLSRTTGALLFPGLFGTQMIDEFLVDYWEINLSFKVQDWFLWTYFRILRKRLDCVHGRFACFCSFPCFLLLPEHRTKLRWHVKHWTGKQGRLSHADGKMKDLKGGRVNLHSVHHCVISPEGMQNVGEGQEEKGRREAKQQL